MPPPSIRVATPADAEIVALYVHSLLDELSDGKPPAIDQVLRHTCDVLASDRVIALLASDDGAPAGVMTLNECMAIYAGGRFGEISELYIEPEKRSRGIAPHLLSFAQEEGRARGWKRIEVGAPSQPRWDRTLGFYLANGFEEVGPRLRILIQDDQTGS